MSSEKVLETPFLWNMGFLITYRCQIACPHCIVEAGPHRKEEALLSDAFKWIQQIANYRNGYIKVLTLTGGEPFYNIEYLKKIADFGEQCGLVVSVVTNAFWASTQEEAVRTLKKIPAIKMIAISTDVYHKEFISVDLVKNAILAAKECNIPYTVAVCTENEDDKKSKEILNQLQEITERKTINTAVTLQTGRALKKLGALKYQISEDPPISACSAGSSPVILPNGRVIACCGPMINLPSSHPLLLGNLHENTLQKILDNAELNSILHAIRIWGPKKLISLIKDAGLDAYLPERYIKDSVCNACYKLMSNSRIIAFLFQLDRDVEFKRKVAYARVYYLKETKMVELLGLNH